MRGVLCWRGRDIADLSREELEAALVQTCNRLQETTNTAHDRAFVRVQNFKHAGSDQSH